MTAADTPLWRQREYMLLWSAQVCTTLGAQASGIVYPLLILALTGSPAQASWAAALRMLPYLALSLPVGALIDRWDRRRVMLTCHIGRGLAVATLPLAMALGTLTLPHIYAVALVEGALFVFFNIAETAALPRVVAPQQLAQATAQNHAGFAAASVLGPAAGSLLYQALRALPFMADAACHALGALALWRLRSSFAPAAAAGPRNLRAEVAEGLRWLWHERLVRDMALITSVLNFLQAALPLFLIVRAKELGAAEAQIGFVFSLGGAGAVLGALVGSAVARRFTFGQAITGTIGVQAATVPLFLLCPGPLWLGAVYAVAAFTGPIYNVVQLSHRLSLIPDGLQGRVNSAFRLLAHGLFPVGAALCGWLLEHTGSVRTVAFFGAVYAALALASWLDPVVRHARSANTRHHLPPQ